MRNYFVSTINFQNYKTEVSEWFPKMHCSCLGSLQITDDAGTSKTTALEWSGGEANPVPDTPADSHVSSAKARTQVNHFNFLYLPRNFCLNSSNTKNIVYSSIKTMVLHWVQKLLGMGSKKERLQLYFGNLKYLVFP